MSAGTTDPRLGQTFARRYRIERCLGRGGMGVVYAAVRLDDQRPVALKLIHPELSANTLVVERFRRELRLSAQLFSPYVVEVLDMGRSDEGELFMVMELLDGQPLSHLLAREGALRAGRVVRIGSQVAQGLAAAHELGIVHRDIKPDNIFVFDRPARGGRPGEKDRAKILDFGVARFLRTEQPVPDADADEWQTLTRQGSLVGTLRYMSPEALVGDDVSPPTDLYSLGVVLYEMVAGEPPFPCEDRQQAIEQHVLTDVTPLRERKPGWAPPALERLILRLMEKEPGDRPASAAEVAAQLVDALEMTEPDLFEELGAALTTGERQIKDLASPSATLIPDELPRSGATLIPDERTRAGGTLIPEDWSRAGATLIPDELPRVGAPRLPDTPLASGATLIPEASPGASATLIPDIPSGDTPIPGDPGQLQADAQSMFHHEDSALEGADRGLHPSGRAEHTVVPEMYDEPDKDADQVLAEDVDPKRPPARRELHEAWAPARSLDEGLEDLPPLRELGDPALTDEATEVLEGRLAELEDEPPPTELADEELVASVIGTLEAIQVPTTPDEEPTVAMKRPELPPSWEPPPAPEVPSAPPPAALPLPSSGPRWELALVAAGALAGLAALLWWLA